MTLGERIKKVRKALDLTQQEFCDRIGLKRNSISLVESDKRNPSKQLFLAICREFNVSEEWLRTGEGEMFAPASSTELDALAAQYPNMTHETYVFVEKLINLPKASQDIIMGFLREVVKGFGNVKPGTLAKAPSEMTAEELHAELDRQLAMEKRSGGRIRSILIWQLRHGKIKPQDR